MTRIVRLIRRPHEVLPAIQRRLRDRTLSERIFPDLLGGPDEIEQLRAELHATGLPAELYRRRQAFEQISATTVRGQSVSSGVISDAKGAALYALARKLKPRIVVETGVCSGLSTALLLKALEINNAGRLYSIDFPEVFGQTYEPGVFWEGKGAAVIPADKSSGWLVPESLYPRWALRLGRTQDLLRPLLDEVGPISLFIHDSEHSYECMSFEFNAAWDSLEPGGVLVSDDIGWNASFFDFAKMVGRPAGRLAGNMGLIVKPAP